MHPLGCAEEFLHEAKVVDVKYSSGACWFVDLQLLFCAAHFSTIREQLPRTTCLDFSIPRTILGVGFMSTRLIFRVHLLSNASVHRVTQACQSRLDRHILTWIHIFANDSVNSFPQSEWVGRQVRRRFDCGEVLGTIVSCLPGRRHEPTLWHVIHADGDEEDLIESEVRS